MDIATADKQQLFASETALTASNILALPLSPLQRYQRFLQVRFFHPEMEPARSACDCGASSITLSNFYCAECPTG
jgi:hypothetical protein